VTALGTIKVRTPGSVNEARRKVHALAAALGFDEVTRARLATATSQLSRILVSGDGGGRIDIALRVDAQRKGLELAVFGDCDPSANDWLATFFDAVQPLSHRSRLGESEDEDRLNGVNLIKWMPRGVGVPNDDMLEAQRARLQQRSREELMDEIQAQNQSLERYNVALEELVAARTLELRRAMELADAANQAKSQFLSNMSHELRTPLNGVLGYAQILQRDPAVTARQRRSLEAIHSCGSHLLTLINDVLDLSKIEAGQLELAPAACNLSELLTTVQDIVRPRADSRGLDFTLTIEPGTPTALITDETKLRQTIVNLAGNAVKFTEKGCVALRASREGDELVLEVRDTGIGMTPDEAASVFEPFKQAEGGKKHGGTGLGLAISRRIIEPMKGTISVSSRKGAGSTFSVRLPLVAASSAPAARGEIFDAKDVVLAPGQDFHLLIADDISVNRDILVTILEDAGFRTTAAENGQQALEMLRRHRCPLVLMDVRMPLMDGIEATAAIRADGALAQTKVIALTASVIDFKDRAVEQGFDDLLGKPVRVEELFEVLRRHFGGALRCTRGQQAESGAPAISGRRHGHRSFFSGGCAARRGRRRHRDASAGRAATA
jgi:signal transduction histidine kinase/CheY-like chemotaxis protein